MADHNICKFAINDASNMNIITSMSSNSNINNTVHVDTLLLQHDTALAISTLPSLIVLLCVFNKSLLSVLFNVNVVFFAPFIYAHLPACAQSNVNMQQQQHC
jgi:hypothetical protein